MADLATLQTRLAEAEEARHQLALGSSVVEVMRGGVHGRRMQFSGDDGPALDAYILHLKGEIERATADANGCPRRRAIGFRF